MPFSSSSLLTLSVISSPVVEAIWLGQDEAVGGKQTFGVEPDIALGQQAVAKHFRQLFRAEGFGDILDDRLALAGRSVASMSAGWTFGSSSFSLNLKSSTLPISLWRLSKTVMPCECRGEGFAFLSCWWSY